jgi:hypothetical protein
MVGPLAAHVALSETVELGVNKRREFLECLLLAVAPGRQELSKLMSPRLVHGGTSGRISTENRKEFITSQSLAAIYRQFHGYTIV